MKITHIVALYTLVIPAPSFADVTVTTNGDGYIETALDYSAINDQFNMEVKIQKAYPLTMQ